MREKWAKRVADLLLVDDNPGDVRLVREAFKAGPLEVVIHVAIDGEEAVRYLRRHGEFHDAPRPDLILLDLNLPRKTGLEVLLEIKNDSQLRHIPVVVMTTSTSQLDIHNAYALNANCYITKPLALDEFLTVMSSIESFWLNTATLPGKCA